ncbi:MAG: NAD-binding protein, partial [Patescibacteria group bacterium]
AQISEFSLILAALGLKVGHIGENVVALITAVGAVTITLSTYLIIYGDKIFTYLSPYLKIFERRKTTENGDFGKEFEKPIILIGSHRTGQSIAFNLPKKDLLIIDFDPDIIGQLRKHDFSYLFGDINDSDIFERANFESARLVISTSPDLEDNLLLLSRLKILKNRDQMKAVLRARTEKEAEILYANGADYVLLPHFTAGQYLGKTVSVDPELKILEQLKNKDLDLMAKVNHKI